MDFKKIIQSDIISWLFCAICLTLSISYSTSYATFLLLFAILFSMPISPVKKAWNSILPKNKAYIKPLAIALIFLISLSQIPFTPQITLATIPPFDDIPYVEIYDNEPNFDENEITQIAFEDYSELDDLGRCGVAVACIGEELMPTEERESISSVKPTGWYSVEYDIVEGGYLYNRSHLIGFQLTGENANEQNLITGTRYMNVDGMLPFENMVADYIDDTGNHVMYRVTPIFYGENVIAHGVVMEAYSVEDDGKGISFHVFVYNFQPGVNIDYTSGKSALAG